MKKLLAMLVCLAGLVLSASSAKAATYDYNVLQSSYLGVATAANEGFHVTLTSADNVNFSVTATALTGGQMPKSDVFNLGFTFTNASNQVVAMTSGTGGTNSPSYNNYLITPAGYFDTSITVNALRANGSNTFKGVFSLANGSANKVQTNFQGLTAQYTTANVGLAPEMPGAALLLPALLPMFGMVLRKKGNFRSKLRKAAV